MVIKLGTLNWSHLLLAQVSRNHPHVPLVSFWFLTLLSWNLCDALFFVNRSTSWRRLSTGRTFMEWTNRSWTTSATTSRSCHWDCWLPCRKTSLSCRTCCPRPIPGRCVAAPTPSTGPASCLETSEGTTRTRVSVGRPTRDNLPNYSQISSFCDPCLSVPVTHLFIYWLARWLTPLPTCWLGHSLLHSLTHSLTHSPARSIAHTLTPSLTRWLTASLTHWLTHWLTR